jgi:ribosomal protein S13
MDQEEIMENLRHFLYFLERKKIVNITEVVQDKTKMNNLIQEIMKIDFKEFNKQSSDKFKKWRSSSGNESIGSQSKAQARRRQGTPVNVTAKEP